MQQKLLCTFLVGFKDFGFEFMAILPIKQQTGKIRFEIRGGK